MKKSNAVFSCAFRTLVLCAAVGAGISLALRHCGVFDPIPPVSLETMARSLGGTLAQISLTLAGFILTSTAIFTAFGDKPLIKNMYKSGHAANLIVHMYVAIFFAITTCVVGVAVVISPAPGGLTLLLLIGLAIASLIALLGVLRKLWFVLHFIHGLPEDMDDYEDVDHTPKEVSPSV